MAWERVEATLISRKTGTLPGVPAPMGHAGQDGHLAHGVQGGAQHVFGQQSLIPSHTSTALDGQNCTAFGVRSGEAPVYSFLNVPLSSTVS